MYSSSCICTNWFTCIVVIIRNVHAFQFNLLMFYGFHVVISRNVLCQDNIVHVNKYYTYKLTDIHIHVH